jgi:Fe-S cluster assembly scaffold protein SufB
MTHEAAIGRISDEALEYLGSRGMTKSEAQSVIIRGFMDVNILALPEALKKDIADLEDKTLRAGL